MDHREILIKSISVFEKKFECHLCMHDYCGKLVQDVLPAMHLNHYCTTLKKNDNKVDRQCRFFDQTVLAQHFKIQNKSFWKKCPFGLLEAVFPVYIENELSGCIFAGVFRGDIPEDAENQLYSQANNKCQFVISPPEIPEDTEIFFTFGEMISAMTAVVSSEKNAIPASGKEMLSEFFRTRHTHCIQLEDAAEFLQLTPARTSDRIKREFGKGFSAVLRDYRLQTACLLLKNSMFSIENIAARCGFSDGAYFHRVFHRQFGITPGEYRLRTQNKTGL